jgi:soluble lytic murein transglycosylase
MSNRRHATALMRLAVAVLAACGFSAFGQSAAALDAVRMHRPEAAALVRVELQRLRRDQGDRPPRTSPDASERRLTLLLGHLLVSDGDPASAAKLLARTPPPSGLEAFHAWTLAEAQSWSGQRAAAVATLERGRRLAPAWLRARMDLRLGELQLGLGRASRAKPLLEAAVASGATAESLYALALARWQLGETGAAHDAFRRLSLRFPAHPHASLSEDFLRRAGQPLVLTADERVQQARQLLSTGAPLEALAALDALLATSGLDPARLGLMRAEALIALGREPEVSQQLESLIAGATPVAAEAWLMRGRRLMRGPDGAAARAAFDAVAQRYPTAPGAEEAVYFGAWISMNLGDLDEAIERFEAFEVRFPRSRRCDEARWFRAYALYRRERFTAAREALTRLLADFPQSTLVAQARYWSARCAQRAAALPDGGAVDVPEELRALQHHSPGTLYAALAAERLRELGASPPPHFRITPMQLVVKIPPQLSLAMELDRVGLFADAAEETRAALTRVKSATDAMTWGHALQRLGDFGAAHALAARHLWGAAYTLRQPEALALMYPRAWRESVEQFSLERGLDPYLAWAVMRRESAFRPEVISTANARGLMQIIPPTARAIAEALRRPAPAPDDLFSPALNLEFGVWYLRSLRDRLKHPALVAAAYNAGPNAVIRWLGQRPGRPLDEWIEEIPYKETRGYVKQVLADALLYRQLYDDEPDGRLELTLPAPSPGGVSF